MTDKRQQIEQVAMDAIRKGGLSSVSFRTLAEDVGVKSSSVHYHFRTKADLAEAVVRSYTDEFSGALAQIAKEEKSLRGRLDRLVTAFEGLVREDNFCLCGALAADAVTLDDNTRRALRTFFHVAEAWVTAVVDEARDELRTDLESADIARVLVAGLEGGGLIDRAVGETRYLASCRNLVNGITTGRQ